MNEKIYLHTINNGLSSNYRSKKQFETLNYILASDAVLSLRKQGQEAHASFSGLDYISLSDYEKRNVWNEKRYHYNSFYGYVRDGISIAFPHESLEVIEPEIISICSDNKEGFDLMYILGLSEEKRYSDLPDEVQVKDSIPLSKMNGILFPTIAFLDNKFLSSKEKKIKLLRKEIDSLHELLDLYGRDTQIYDVDSLEELTLGTIESIVLHKQIL